jgi:hypothetical protein
MDVITVLPLGVNLTPLKDEDGKLILCSTVCTLGEYMKDCPNCKQLSIFTGENNVT